MITHCTLETLRNVARLSSEARAAMFRANRNRRAYHSYGEMEPPRTRTPEEISFRGSLDDLTHDQLVELQACYWFGENCWAGARTEHAFRSFLEYSGENDGRLAEYLSQKGYLAESLERALDFLVSRPDLVQS